MKCLSCENEIIEQSREDIIQYSLGGRYNSRSLLCKPCNDTLGNQIDDVLVDWLRFKNVRNVLMLRGHSGSVPEIEVSDEQGNKYIAREGGKLFSKHEPPRYQRYGRGVCAAFSVDAEADLDHIVNGIGTTLTRQVLREAANQSQQLSRSIPSPKVQPISKQHVIKRPASFELQPDPWGKDEHYRAVAKIAFEYLATKLPRADILGSQFRPIRDFIYRGQRGNHEELWFLDYRDIYTVCEPRSQPFFHRVTVYCNGVTSNIIGLVELFGHVRIAVVLSWQYEGRKQGYSLIEYPLEQRHEDRIDEHVLPDFSPILTQMITKPSLEDIDQSDADFQQHMKLLDHEVYDHHTRAHIDQVLADFLTKHYSDSFDDIDTLIMKATSYYALKCNNADRDRLIDKDTTYFLDALLRLRADRFGPLTPTSVERAEWIERIQRTWYVQRIVEALASRSKELSA